MELAPSTDPDAVRRFAQMLDLIAAERAGYEERKLRGEWKTSCADAEMDPWVKLGVLGEEFGEIARDLLEGARPERLREELIQLAASAAAWAESLPDH